MQIENCALQISERAAGLQFAMPNPQFAIPARRGLAVDAKRPVCDSRVSSPVAANQNQNQTINP